MNELPEDTEDRKMREQFAALPWQGPSQEHVEQVVAELRLDGFKARMEICRVDKNGDLRGAFWIDPVDQQLKLLSVWESVAKEARIFLTAQINGIKLGVFMGRECVTDRVTAIRYFWEEAEAACHRKFGPGMLTRLDNKRATWRTE